MAPRRIRTLSITSLCLSLATLIVSCGRAVPSTPPASPAAPPAAQNAVASGKSLFESHCAVCHGRLGEGGQAPDGSIATPLSTHLRAHADLPAGVPQIIRAVLDGVYEEAGGTRAISDAMPRFRDKLSAAEVTDIISYMETLP